MSIPKYAAEMMYPWLPWIFEGGQGLTNTLQRWASRGGNMGICLHDFAHIYLILYIVFDNVWLCYSYIFIQTSQHNIT